MFHSRGSLRDPTLDRGAIHDYGVRAETALGTIRPNNRTLARGGWFYQPQGASPRFSTVTRNLPLVEKNFRQDLPWRLRGTEHRNS